MNPTPLDQLHDGIEACLFAAQDLPHTREQALVATKLEEALLWAKRLAEKEAQQ